jgi:uncharacterized protein YgbK (DUF1537 family)
MLLGCIGDDFTGSGDLANTLARAGMRATLYAGVPDGAVDRAVDRAVEAGVVALKSRTVSAPEAVAQSLAALDWLRAQGCRQILFKYCSTFDSTPAGNIGPVAEALADRLDARRVIVCPAFPGAGRTLYMGHLFVGDRLLSESGMQDHPLTPMTDPDIRRWLSRQTQRGVGHVAMPTVRQGPEAIAAALAREEAAGRLFVVVDATGDADLMAIGAAAADLPLVTGGSGVAMGLPAGFAAKGLLAGTAGGWRGEAGRCAILSGSCSRATRAQVARHARSHPAREVGVGEVLDGTLTAEGLAGWLLAQGGLPLAFSSADPARVAEAQRRHGRERSAAAIEGLFAAVARRLVAAGVRRLVTAGGETSGAVVEALAPGAMEVGPEIAPGVPCLRAGDLVLALKSGNFGDEGFFEDAAAMLGRT